MKRLNEQGAIALLSVVIFSTIITIVITAYIHSAITQQSEASNYDYGTRAYYSAESGVQDAVRGINNDINFVTTTRGDKCQPLSNGLSGQAAGQLGTDMGLGYTCQIVSTTPKTVTGDVSDDKNATVRLSPKTPDNGTYKLVVNWSLKDEAAATLVGRSGSTDANTSKALYPRDLWRNTDGSTIHPMVKLSVISIPKTATFTRNDIKQNVLFLNPISAVPSGTTGINLSTADNQDPATITTNAQCYSNKGSSNFGGYSCQRTIDLNGYDFTTNNVYLRLHSVYGATAFQVSMKTSTSTAVELANAQATVDVTGVSSNVYRRVRQTVPLSGGVSYDTWPDASLVAGDGICKLFTVGATAAQFQNDCDPTQ